LSKQNKVYYFQTHKDADCGVFVGAQSWKEGRKEALTTETFDDYEFIEITGHVCRENRKAVVTDKVGELDVLDLLATGYTKFYWNEYPCDNCKSEAECSPCGPKMLCSKCIEEIEWGEAVQVE